MDEYTLNTVSTIDKTAVDTPDCVENLLLSEENRAECHLHLSDGAFYALILLFAILAVRLSYSVSVWFNIERGYAQLALYGLMALSAYLISRFRLSGYRYLLTNRSLIVEAVVGQKARTILAIRLSDIIEIQFDSTNGTRLYRKKQGDALCVTYHDGKRVKNCTLSPTASFCEELRKQWQKNL